MKFLWVFNVICKIPGGIFQKDEKFLWDCDGICKIPMEIFQGDMKFLRAFMGYAKYKWKCSRGYEIPLGMQWEIQNSGGDISTGYEN